MATLRSITADGGTPPPARSCSLQRSLRSVADLLALVRHSEQPRLDYGWESPACKKRHRLRDAYGQAGNFVDLELGACASRLPVATQEDAAAGGLRVESRAAALRDLRRGTQFVVRATRMRPWLDALPVLTLQAAVRYCAERAITPTAVEDAFSRGMPRPWPEDVARRVRGNIRRAVLGRLRQASPYDSERRMRRELERWRMPGPPRRTARTALRELWCPRLSVPPRVWGGGPEYYVEPLATGTPVLGERAMPTELRRARAAGDKERGDKEAPTPEAPRRWMADAGGGSRPAQAWRQPTHPWHTAPTED